MINALVLDFGGVIVRTEDRSHRNKLEEEYRIRSVDIDSLVFNSPVAISAMVGEVDPDAIWDYVGAELSLTPQSLEKFQETFWAGDEIDFDLIQFFKSCRPEYKTAILSNAWMNLREVLSEKYGIKEGKTVDYILVSAELSVAKPDPEIYQILADTLQCPYEEILFIDDFIENIEAANSLGINTIHYQPGLDLINEIKSRLEKS